MKIFQVHNKYNFYGGEDSVADEEAKLLRSKKHSVIQIFRDNKNEINNSYDKISIFKNLPYSKKSTRILKDKLKYYGRPDLVHIHNTFPLWTYSILDFFKEQKIPIVFTLHNYRMILHKIGLFNKYSEKYGYFKNSKLLTYFISRYLNKKYFLIKNIDTFITHTDFTKKIFIKYGIDPKKITVKPNFIENTSNHFLSIKKKNNAIYASRISKEKGILTLLEASKKTNLKLDILGDGPLKNKLFEDCSRNIKFHGNLDRDQVQKYIRKSKFLVYPSEWYEIFGMTLIEAFNQGTLVLASNIGSIKSVVKDKVTGLLFESGNINDLVNKINWIKNNPVKCDKIVKNAKKEFIKKYTAEENYNQLLKIYKKTINAK